MTDIAPSSTAALSSGNAAEGTSVVTADRSATALGWRVFGVGVMALATVSLGLGDFLPGHPVPKDFPGRSVLAFGASVFMLCAGAGVEWRRTAAWSAAALTGYYLLVVIMLMHGRVLLANYTVFVTYSNVAMQLSIAAGGLIVYAANANIERSLAVRLTRLGQFLFGGCSLLFGGAHFIYLNMTTPLVPKWLPPSQEFLAYATGVGFIAAGVSILIGVQSRLAAILLTAMFASFTLLTLGPLLVTNPSIPLLWIKNATNLAVLGAAWVVADSLARPSVEPSQTLARR